MISSLAGFRFYWLSLLPAVVNTPLFIGIQYVEPLVEKVMPRWVYFLVLFGCASLVIFNPLIKKVRPGWPRFVTLAGAFLLWCILLELCDVIVLMIFFHEGF